MNKTVLALVCVIGFVGWGVSGTAQDAAESREAKAAAEEKIFVPEEGVQNFTVTGRSTLFRITVSTLAGGKIEEPVIKGKAMKVRSAVVTTVDKDGHPHIGALVKEFVFRGTAAGKVEITFKRTIPTSPMPEVEEYHVTIR